jgi:nucleotide-binding universal stress UspA family protein
MKPVRKPAVIGAFAGANQAQEAPAGGGSEAHRAPAGFGRILVPTDFSDPSKRALKCAARFVAHFGSKVTLIHVIEPVMSPDFTNFPLALDEDKVLETARQRLASLGRAHIDTHHLEAPVVRSGNPFHEIAETARELHIDLIIIATHGYTGIKRALLGSTAERVVRYAQCPVMTVR